MDKTKLELYWSEIPIGKENAIEYSDLCTMWGKDERTVRAILHELSLYDNGDNYVLIRSASGKGFYRTDNEAIIKAYRQKHIKARLSEGFTIEDFKTVIDKKCAEWLGTDYEQYLRPQTLFGTKFESYLNAPSKARKGRSGVVIKEPAEDDLAGIL